jgi:hypothetical protein
MTNMCISNRVLTSASVECIRIEDGEEVKICRGRTKIGSSLDPAAAERHEAVRPAERADAFPYLAEPRILEGHLAIPPTPAVAISTLFSLHLPPYLRPAILRRFGVIFVLLLLPLVTFLVHQLPSLLEQLALRVQGFGSCAGA